jgi:hypothetical protein
LPTLLTPSRRETLVRLLSDLVARRLLPPPAQEVTDESH